MLGVLIVILIVAVAVGLIGGLGIYLRHRADRLWPSEGELAEKERLREGAPARKYPTEGWSGYGTVVGRIAATIVGWMAAALFIVYAVTHWGGVSFSRTATFEQVQTIKGEFYLYLNDGTVWRLENERLAGPNPNPYYVLAGDEIRFEHVSGKGSAFDAGGDAIYSYEFCLLHNETRQQDPVLAERVAGDPKRDSCPAH